MLGRPEWDWEEWDKENRVDPTTGKIHKRNGDEEMAIDWGAVASGAIDIMQGQAVGGGPATYGAVPPMAYGPAPAVAPVGAVEIDPRTGKPKCKRRRRRRLLTPTDLSDLAALQAIVGKGDALKLAVAKAVRR